MNEAAIAGVIVIIALVVIVALLVMWLVKRRDTRNTSASSGVTDRSDDKTSPTVQSDR